MRSPPAFFDGVAPEALEAALAALEWRRFPAGAIILAEGDYREEMYVLRAGSAHVVLVDRKGVEHVVGTVQAGEAIGEMSLLTQSPASATVRAAEDVELLVLQGPELDALLDSFPELQRNVIATLSARLARVTRLSLHERPGRVIVLVDDGAPELLGPAVAASVAWHTRSPTLYVALGLPHPETLESTAGPDALYAGARAAGAESIVSEIDGHFSADEIESTLDELARTYEHVLLHVRSDLPRRPRGDRTVRLDPDGGIRFQPRAGGPEQVLRIPALSAEDIASLEQGLLPATAGAGAAIGRLARELANLKVGVALGAGSIRGYAHIGALRALERHGIPVDCLAGTSIGATVAGVYAHFGDADRAGDFLDELGARMFRPIVSRKSLLSTQAMRRYTRKVLGDPLLEEFPIPIAFVATDVDTQDEVVLKRGRSIAAVFASAAVPGVFPAVRIGNRTLVDGGVVNPVPADVAASLGADVVIGVRLVHPGGIQSDEVSEEADGPIPSAVAAIMRSIELLQTRIAIESSVPTILVTPEFGSLPAGKLRHFGEGRRFIAAGEAAVEEALPRLSAALPWLRPIDVDSKRVAAARH
jgi:predicted acylesterase/phospholipase RssA/CRP-like cAMP-binding protein